MPYVVAFLIFVTFVHSNQLDRKSLQRRCDLLEGTTCECADPLGYWREQDELILKINENFDGQKKIICYVTEFINATTDYDTANEAQNCTNLEKRYDVSLEPALFLSLQTMETLIFYLKQNFTNYQSDEILITTGLSFDKKEGFFWINNTNNIHKSILPLIEQINITDSCFKIFLSYRADSGILLKAIECATKIPQYIRACYYAMNYIESTSKVTDIISAQFKKGNLSKITKITNINNMAVTTSRKISTANWYDECYHFLWTFEDRRICYVAVVRYFKRTESLRYNLVNKMCSKEFPWIPARIRHRQQISALRNFVESFLEENKIYLKHVPVLIGLIHIRGMGFIWTSGNNGSYLNSLDPNYNSLYDEMPFWIDPTFHPHLNTTEIHCHRFVIWTHNKDFYAHAIPCEYATNINLVLCEYDMENSINQEITDSLIIGNKSSEKKIEMIRITSE